MPSFPIPISRLRGAFSLLVLSLAVAAGCGGGQVRDPMRPGSASEGIVRLTVQNNDFKDAVVYAIFEGSTRKRVGLVTGKTSQTFTFDWEGPTVRLEADFIAGGTFMVDPIEVWGGDHLDLVIMNQG